ncbi:hypothetical protein PXK56_17775 [Phaeobacter gallaeciensis]|uniref:hypothetical protein n=1 Tax=Phaeobacter gallaeciensis TaxID=60890 RepID=UPI00238067F5|nr:hypothetical protein [Phaeobacter gallaeciensis]MDE4297038.1 hypothetical protein [Phaeobacter gallaeciensis]
MLEFGPLSGKRKIRHNKRGSIYRVLFRVFVAADLCSNLKDSEAARLIYFPDLKGEKEWIGTILSEGDFDGRIAEFRSAWGCLLDTPVSMQISEKMDLKDGEVFLIYAADNATTQNFTKLTVFARPEKEISGRFSEVTK